MPAGLPSPLSIMEDYSNLEADAPQPRLCHLRKRPDFSGYGFNLHAEKGLSGHFIGKIDPDSPAEAAGLREGDRIVEVNGTNIGMENHQQVVERIRAVPDETIFLVVDTETDAYYRDRKVVISSNMPNVNRIDVETSFEPELEPAHSNDDSAAAADESHYDGRLCKLRIWPDFTGYGFNLHAERGKEGQFIGKVDEGSPAEAAGLREGDRIIAVNGHDVADKSHSEVVQCIRAEVGHVDLLVVDMETNIKMESSGTSLTTSSIDQIETIECPPSNPHSANGVVTAEDVDELEPATTAATAADDDAVVVAETEPTVDAEVAAEIEPVADTVPIADAVVEDHQTNGATVEEVVPEPPPTPSDDEHLYARLCHVKAWPNGAGYGFSMQAEKGRSGQYVGTVDPGSPADLAGLRFGDRIVEVNGSNVEAFSHKQVVEKIREKTDEVRLLVVDAEADQYFRSQDIKIYALMNWIKTIECPSSDPNKHAADGEHTFSGKSMDEQSLANLTIQTSVTSDDANVADYEQVTNELTELANSQSLNDNKDVLSDSATLSTTHSTDYHNESTSYTTTTTPTPASWSATSSATSAAVQTSYDTSRELTSSTTANNSVLSPLSSPSSATATANLTGQSIAEAAVAAAAKITLAPKGPVVIGGVEFAASVEEARKRVVSKRDKNKKANSMSLKDKYALYQKL